MPDRASPLVCHLSPTARVSDRKVRDFHQHDDQIQTSVHATQTLRPGTSTTSDCMSAIGSEFEFMKPEAAIAKAF